MGIIWDLLYCIHQCGWNISLQVLLHLFKAKHMVVCVCVFMWICRNCKAIVWMRVRRERSDQDQHKFLPNTLLSLLEPCLAVILKKSELRTDGGGSPRLLFFSCFSLFLWYFSSFFCVRVRRLLLFCGMDNINKRDSRERQKKYTTYITLCYEQNINL